MSKNVFHFLEEDLYTSNKGKKKWWLHIGGNIITSAFQCYDIFEFNLSESNITYKIEQICDKGFLNKLKALFKRQEPFYEISIVEQEKEKAGEGK